MSTVCPHCQHATWKSDAFCFYCGTRLKTQTIIADDDFSPVPGVIGQPDLRIHKKRRSKPARWYRKPAPKTLVMTTMIFLIGSVIAILPIIWPFFDDVTPIHTSPPVVSGSVLDEHVSGFASIQPVQQARKLALQALEISQPGDSGDLNFYSDGA